MPADESFLQIFIALGVKQAQPRQHSPELDKVPGICHQRCGVLMEADSLVCDSKMIAACCSIAAGALFLGICSKLHSSMRCDC